MPNNEVFKALSDPTRREILRLLAGGEKSAGELAEKFDMTKPSMSHHFSVLKEADLITSRREGQQIFYAVNTTVVQDVLRWLFEFFGSPKLERGKKT
jgi:ArsR family transcriptional regulator, arsenate/arsenite/antimonite-responsive transcriptional repressor